MTDPNAGAVPHVAQPLPVGHAIFWTPAAPAAPEPAGDGYAIFVEQGVLTAVQEHVESRRDQGLMGFFVGDLFQCPETETRYVVIDSTLRLSKPIVSHNTRDMVRRMWNRVQEELRSTKGQWLRECDSADGPPGGGR